MDIFQHEDESMEDFVSRLQFQAASCQFMITCQCCAVEVDYTQEMLINKLLHGLNNPERRQKVISEILLSYLSFLLYPTIIFF